MSALQPGTRLRSQTCATEVVVVRPGTGTVVLTCGGAPMIPLGAIAATSGPGAPAAGLDTGSAVGKRYYADADPTVEVLVTKGGAGTLADGAVPLLVRSAKPLPASD